MALTKVWLANKGNSVRVQLDGNPKQGSGDNKRIYVGRMGGTTKYDYWGYLNFAFDWPASGKIVSAVLTLTTDDGLGILGDVMADSDNPQVAIRQLASAFSEGTGNETWDTDDYTAPTVSSVGTGYRSVARDQLGQTNIDITNIVESWAPGALKQRTGKAGLNKAKHGVRLFADTNALHNAAFISDDAEAGVDQFKPYITLTYEPGLTTPDVPVLTNPVGAVASIGSFQGTFSDSDTTDKMRYSEVQVYTSAALRAGTADEATNRINLTAHGFAVGQEVWFTALTGGVGLSLARPYYVRAVDSSAHFRVALTVGGAVVDITTDYSALTVGKHVGYSVKLAESATAIDAAIFDHVPVNLTLLRNTTYKWRARVYDQDGSVSAWSGLTSFSVTNTNPDAPVLSPDGSSYETLDGVVFTGGTFTDDDPEDTLLAYEVQLSAYPEGDPGWDEPENYLWATGKRYRGQNTGTWSTPYGGSELTSGTYYWRARVWDDKQGVSDWAYASLTLTADFEADPDFSVNAIQMRPRAPWRIVIKAMGALRGPGAVVAVLEDAMNVGASLMYNSPGEAHFTLSANHPQLSAIEVKQTHYSIQFRQGDGWREVFAGLMWDFDATHTDIVFYGIDYLALYDYVVDEQYKASNAEAAYNKGGSKYSSVAIRTIVADQLAKAKKLPNSPVGFITAAAIPGGVMTTTLTVYSTYSPVLNFLSGLVESYRAGSGKFTRLQVKRVAENSYQFVVTDDPGIPRDNLRLRYGEMVQGFRIVPFGSNWGTRIAAIGRDKDGVKVRYHTRAASGVDEATWGRFILPQFMDGVSDDNDLKRRAAQFIKAASMLGKQMGLGLRSGVLQPRDGYELLDRFPVDVKFGAVDTAQFGHDGYWVAVGITWQSKSQGNGQTTLTLHPQEEGSAPSADLLVASPISGQKEWQIGWQDPNPLEASSQYWLDQSTGVVWTRTDGDTLVAGITGDV